jgi:preprotein translocase subunit SecD
MNKYRTWSLILLVLMVVLGWVVYTKSSYKLGLDLAGGTELVYKANTAGIPEADINDRLNSLRVLIEKRINPFGVGEQVVQLEGANAFTKEPKLVVELPGVTNTEEAINIIGKTPRLDFRLLSAEGEKAMQSGTTTKQFNELFTETGLTGQYLETAQLTFDQFGSPTVSLVFNDEGGALFAKITKENLGRVLAIFLDDQIISQPVIQSEISNGEAQITGGFSNPEAKALVDNLKNGALPIPIEHVGTQTIGPSLGASALNAGIRAGLWGFAIIALFLILWYRLPGFVATVALVMYIIISLLAFKFIPVTLTAAGIAGFILSIGMAVDANVLIFERMKEELRKGRNLHDAMHEGFHRAWLSIRDSNVSSLITSVVLFWLGTSSVKGFALTLGLGVLISMFTAITVSRTFLFALSTKNPGKLGGFLFGSGLRARNLTNNPK